MRRIEVFDEDEERAGKTKVAVELRRETTGAWLVFDGTREVWIPKSQGELEVKGRGWELTVPEWLAKKAGLL
jgi:hypothetical protein